MKPERKVDWADALVIVGAGLICYGLWQVYVPLAWLAAGAFLFWFGVKAG